MWSLVIDKANEAAKEAKEKARSEGKSESEVQEAGERAYRGDVLDTAKRHIGGELKVGKWLSGLFD